jgi:sulfite exporter TauE/SafE
MHGFLLGLANGTTCLAVCAPVLVPYLMGEAKTGVADVAVLLTFLGGRLAGYLAFAVLAWSVGALAQPRAASFPLLIALAWLVLGALMVWYGLTRPRAICAGSAAGRLGRWKPLAGSPLLPAAMGFLTGLNVCPPFLLAFTEAAAAPGLAGSLLFFLAFFLGTSVFFLPFPFLGGLRRHAALQTVGRLAAVLVGVFYFWMGAARLLGWRALQG